MSENIRVTKAAGVVAGATLLSRIFGFIRDVVVAWFFGAGLASDAFFVAFRIPNLLRRLLAEGSLSIAFIPVFTDHLARNGKEEAFLLARAALRLISVLLAVVAVLGILLSPLIVRIVGVGFAESPEKLALTVTLTRIMFPYIFFIGLVALSMGILNVLGHFAAPALAPVFLNIAMIGSVFLISPHLDEPIIGLAVGVLIGGALQLLLQVPFLIRNGLRFWQKAGFYHPGLKQVGVLMLPTVFGAAVYQINILIGTLLASLLPEGSVSYLYYADRLVEFPLGIFAIATATAVLPSLSRQAAARDFAALRTTFVYAMNLVSYITIPAMVGLIVLRQPIVALLFQRGAFNAETVRMTAMALLYYAVGLWAISAVRIVVSTFYALKDTKTPVRMAAISLAANVALSVILMQWLRHGGLALATSLAAMVNLVLLLKVLRARLGSLGWEVARDSILKTVVCSAAMGVAVWGVALAAIPGGNISALRLLSGLVVTIGAGLVSYGVFSYLARVPELEMVLSLLGKRFAKKGAGDGEQETEVGRK
ncbi:MAG: murein biosynthesis integral membrane protein MurJ [Thermodesulfobacteriota bacterium]